MGDGELLVDRQLGDRVESLHDLGGAAGARVAVGIDHGEDQRLELGGHVGHDAPELRRRVVPCHRQLGEVARGIGVAAGERVVEGAAEREEIGAGVQVAAVDDLGGADGRRAHHLAAWAHGRHGAEVDQLGQAVAGAADVARADVAMHQLARVEQGERGTDVADPRARPLPLDRREPVEVAAVEQLHRVPGALAMDAVVVHLHHARVCELGQGQVFALE